MWLSFLINYQRVLIVVDSSVLPRAHQNFHFLPLFFTTYLLFFHFFTNSFPWSTTKWFPQRSNVFVALHLVAAVRKRRLSNERLREQSVSQWGRRKGTGPDLHCCHGKNWWIHILSVCNRQSWLISFVPCAIPTWKRRTKPPFFKWLMQTKYRSSN